MSQYKIFKRMLSKRTGRIETIEIANNVTSIGVILYTDLHLLA